MNEFEKARAYALKRLGMKSELSSDLKKALLRKGYSEDIADKIVYECQQLGYLNDDEWIERYIDRFSRTKGARSIAYALQCKGIDSDPVKEKIAALKPQEPDQINHLLHTKYAKKDLSDPKQKQKVIASLARKGFSLDNILKEIHKS
jgi:regulatory protein